MFIIVWKMFCGPEVLSTSILKMCYVSLVSTYYEIKLKFQYGQKEVTLHLSDENLQNYELF